MLVICKQCGIEFKTYASYVKKGRGKFCSRTCYGKWRSGNFRDENHWNWENRKEKPDFKCFECGKKFKADVPSRKRKFCSVACCRKGQIAGRKGENNPNWKNGISTETSIIRNSKEYRDWRKAVFGRDYYTCQRCLTKSGRGNQVYLHAHHIIPFSVAPEERFKVDNGATLCIDCHKWIRTNEISV